MTLQTAFIAPSSYKTSSTTMRHLVRRMLPTYSGPIGSFTLATVAGQLQLTTPAAGFEYVLRGSSLNQGSYYVWTEAAETINFETANSDPRWDTVVLAVADSEYGATVVDGPKFKVIKGTPAASPTKLSDGAIASAMAAEAGAYHRVADVKVNGSATELVAGADISITCEDVFGVKFRSPSGGITAGGSADTWVDVSSGSIAPLVFTVPPSGKVTCRVSANVIHNNDGTAWLSYRLSWSGGSIGEQDKNGTKGSRGNRATAVRTFTTIPPGTVVTLTPQTYRNSGTAGNTDISSILIEVVPEPW